MIRMATKATSPLPSKETTFFTPGKPAASNAKGSPQPDDVEWEVRPGGMLVQRRNPDSDDVPRPTAPTVRVRVKYGAAHHEIYLSSQATFGELKKLLSERTGMHSQDQKLLFKGKERESGAFLDISGVKDRSKVVLVEDPAAQARRFLEMRKTAKMEKAAKSVSQIGLEIDKLASKVSQLESIVSKGKKVADADVISLIEELMNQLLKLDGIMADGDVKLQRGIQVRRVQTYVETLDVVKIKNSMMRSDSQMQPQQQQRQNNYSYQYRHDHQQQRQQQQQKNSQPHHYHQQQQQQVLQRTSEPPVVVTTNWETFDLLSGPPITSVPPTATVASAAIASATPIPRFEWELF